MNTPSELNAVAWEIAQTLIKGFNKHYRLFRQRRHKHKREHSYIRQHWKPRQHNKHLVLTQQPRLVLEWPLTH